MMLRSFTEPASIVVPAGQGDLYLVHRILADYPQAYAAVREAFRVRDAAKNQTFVCSRCQCPMLPQEDGGGGGGP
jgi:hypothetical protein